MIGRGDANTGTLLDAHGKAAASGLTLHRLRRGVARAALACLTLEGIVAVLAVPLLTASALAGSSDPLSQPWALAVGLVFVFAAFLLQAPSGRLFRHLAATTLSMPSHAFLALALGVGLAIRAGWMLAVPSPEISDSAAYLDLAQDLVAGTPYEIAGTRSYWPPGYPLFLAPLLALLGPGFWVPKLGNLILYAALVPPAYALARRCAEDGAARLAILLIAVWPGFFSAVAYGNKELLLATLLVLAAWCYTAPSRTAGIGAAWAAASGAAIGFAALTQPSILPLPLGLLLYDLLRGLALRALAARIACFAVAAAVVIAPWTIRNHAVHGEFVLISTNGGNNFYYGNNPAATGTYAEQGVEDLSGLGELAASRVGAQLGKEWILANPLDFAGLAVKKQVFLLGDDASAIYVAVRRGLGIDDIRYDLLKAGTNALWLGLCVIVLAACFAGWRVPPVELAPVQCLVVAFWLYPYLLHSVVMSMGRYHLPFLPFLAIALAALMMPGQPRRAG